MTPPGLKVRRISGQWLGLLQVGAGTIDEARALGDAYMARHGITAEYAKTSGGSRLKVGIMGMRRYDVLYRLERRP